MRWLNGPWSWLQRHARRVALGLWLTCLLLLVVALTLDALIVLGQAPGGRVDAVDVHIDPGFFALATFGALIISRWPGQMMGWLFCCIGLQAMISWMALAYEQFAGAEALPLLGWVLWFGNAFGFMHLLMLLMIVPYLFPSGRPLSRRWWPLIALAVVTIVGVALEDTFAAGEIGIDDRQLNDNPARIAAVESMTDALAPLALVTIPLVLLGAIVSTILRFRRARGVERLQLRWLLWMLGLILGLVLVFLLGQTAGLLDTSDDTWTVPEIGIGVSILLGIGIGIPIVLGLSILRYRLYSIDHIINRTLVYSALSLGLGALYGGSVVLLQQLLDPLTSGSDLAVAGSTLTVAALVQPLRRRIQRLVNRRFYRRTFDAATTIEGFSAQLRDAVDLETLLTDLRVVVQETMQPAHVSLWLRPGASRSQRV